MPTEDAAPNPLPTWIVQGNTGLDVVVRAKTEDEAARIATARWNFRDTKVSLAAQQQR